MSGAVAPLPARERALAWVVIVLVPLDVALCGWLAVRRHARAIVPAAPALDALLLAGGVLFLAQRRAGGLRALGLTPRRLARLVAIALAVAGLSARLAGLPRTRQLFGAAAIAELVIVAAIALGLGRGLDAVLPARVRALLAAELAVWPALGRALGRRPLPAGDRLTVTRASRWPQLAVALITISLFEMAAVHALLHAAPATVHLGILGAHLYGVVWLAADVRLLAEGGVRVAADEVVVALGLRGTTRLPRRAIVAARRLAADGRRTRGAVRLTPADAPNVELVLVCPVEIGRPFGLRRTADRVQLYVDDPDRLLTLLA